MKEQIEREYKEIEQCKKDPKGTKNDKVKTPPQTSPDYKPTGLDRVVSPCRQDQEKAKFTSTPNERISSNAGDVTHNPWDIPRGFINGVAATCAKYTDLAPFLTTCDQ